MHRGLRVVQEFRHLHQLRGWFNSFEESILGNELQNFHQACCYVCDDFGPLFVKSFTFKAHCILPGARHDLLHPLLLEHEHFTLARTRLTPLIFHEKGNHLIKSTNVIFFYIFVHLEQCNLGLIQLYFAKSVDVAICVLIYRSVELKMDFFRFGGRADIRT